MSLISFLKALFLYIVVPHGADGDHLGPGHIEGGDHGGPEHHKKVEMNLTWSKNSFPVIFKEKNAFQMLLMEVFIKADMGIL